jgi:hypothetical protein
MSTEQNLLTPTNNKKWDTDEWRRWFLRRLANMRTKRLPYDKMWENIEVQNNSVSYENNDGFLEVNIPIEKTCKEIYMGRTEWKIPFEIIPDGQANVEDLQPTKYAMNFFIDGNDKDNFWKENRAMRDKKATYGSWIFSTNIRVFKDFRYEIKKGVEIEGNEDLQNEDNFEEVEYSTWQFFPKDIHCRDFYIDDNNYGNPDVQKAQDCIWKEKISRFDFEIRYKDNPNFINTDKVIAGIDLKPKNENDSSIDRTEIMLYHYFHRGTKKYIINANEMENIFEGRYLYDDGKLPFVNIQHYYRDDRFWWEWIYERIGYLKAYKSEIFNDILSGAMMASSVNLITGNDDQMGQDWTIWGRGVNVWRTAGGAESVKPVDTHINIWFFTAILDLLDKQLAIDSGINPWDQIDPWSDKVGIVEIMESNKSVRNRSVDENYNTGIDEALTMMLSRLKQFAPSLLCNKIMSEDKKSVLKVEFPKIRIDNAIVKKRKNGIEVVENMGQYWYFDLKPGVIQGIGVKITTPSTNSLIPILERQKINEYTTNITSVWNLAMMDSTGGMMEELKKSLNIPDLMAWMNDAYGYDQNGLKANTQKDDIRKKNLDKLQKMQEFTSQSALPNALQSETPPASTPPTGWLIPTPTAGVPATPNPSGWMVWADVSGGGGMPNQGSATPMM